MHSRPGNKATYLSKISHKFSNCYRSPFHTLSYISDVKVEEETLHYIYLIIATNVVVLTE